MKWLFIAGFIYIVAYIVRGISRNSSKATMRKCMRGDKDSRANQYACRECPISMCAYSLGHKDCEQNWSR